MIIKTQFQIQNKNNFNKIYKICSCKSNSIFLSIIGKNTKFLLQMVYLCSLIGFSLFFYVQKAQATLIAGSERIYNGHIYALLESESWINSQAEAILNNANLVTINDEDENNFIYNTYSNFGGESLTIWTGLHFVDDGDGIIEPANGVYGTDDWQWISGDQSSYRNWWPYDPNGYWSQPYVAIVPPWQANTKQWFDAENNGSGYNVFGVIEQPVVPEPSTIIMMFSMLSGIALLRKK